MPHTKKPQIYLDHNASTPVDQTVIDAMLPFFGEVYANPSSIHRQGKTAQAAIEDARALIARTLRVRESEIYFCAGGTEANNLALVGAAIQNRERGRHIISSAVEHPSVYRTCQQLWKSGFELTSLPVDHWGQVAPASVQAAIRPDTILVSVMHANNEVGTFNDIESIARLAKSAGVLFHTDAVQTFGKYDIDLSRIQADLLTISAHKINGPKGIGALFIRKGTELAPQLSGGNQERRKRAGTENVPGIVGLKTALQLTLERRDTERERIGRLRDQLGSKLLAAVPGAVMHGPPGDRLYNTLNISFPGCESEKMLMALDMQGIAVSSGSACSSGSVEPSLVLTAMGTPAGLAKSSIRISLGGSNTLDEIEYTARTIEKIVLDVRRKQRD